MDDKILTSWNGMVLSTLSVASRILDSEQEKRIAQQLANFLLNELISQDGLMRSWRKGSARYTAYLEDHAALGLVLLELYQVDFDPRWYQAAVDQREEILDHFTDSNGGFFDTRNDHEKLIAHLKILQDSPTPSGNTLAVSLLLRLAALTGEARYVNPAERAVRAMQENARCHPTAFAGWLCEIDFALGPELQLALMGTWEMEGFYPLKKVAHYHYLPRMVIAGGMPDRSPKPSLLENRVLIDGRPTAYLCEGFTCKLPTTSAETLDHQLKDIFRTSL